MARQLSERRLLFVTGKGGVGKTTLAAAMARAVSARGKRVLLMEIGELGLLGPLFGVDDYGYEPTEVHPGVLLSRITQRDCLREYGLRKLKLKRLYNLVFENSFVRALLNMLPGMEELLLVGKIGFMVQTAMTSRRAPFDLVIVDAPPTGQGAGLISLPATILAAVTAGPVAREVRALHELLTDPDVTGVLIVTIPEELGVDEALELEDELANERELPACAVVVNRAIPDIFKRLDGEVIERFVHAKRARRDSSWAYPLFNTAHSMLHLWKEQEEQIHRLRNKSKLPILLLPLLAAHGPKGEQSATLADSLTTSLDRESL